MNAADASESMPMPMPRWYSTLSLLVSDDGAPAEVRDAVAEALSSYGGMRLDRRDLYTKQARLELELRQARAELDDLRAQQQAALALHQPAKWAAQACEECSHGCGAGEVEWPCSTVSVLSGGTP